MSAKIKFIWGAGGVGKSHFAIREAALTETDKCLLITLDPSPRIFYLCGLKPQKTEQWVSLGAHRFCLLQTDADKLFEQLHAVQPANEKVRIYYQELVNGLQRFRDYLALIQLAEELAREDFDLIIVDTPPFHEAMGLHESIFTLGEFFEKSLVKLAVKSSILSLGVKKIIEIIQKFIGKRGLDNVLAFMEWIHLHVNRFTTASKKLEKLSYDKETEHILILTPETDSKHLSSMKKFFDKTQPPRIILNRAVTHFKLPNEDSDLKKEIQLLAERQNRLEDQIQSLFPKSDCQRFSLSVMGEDTREELSHFLKMEGLGTTESRRSKP